MAIEVKGLTPMFQVFDMPTSMKFYCEVLGFEVVTVDDPKKAPHHDWVWLRLNDANQRRCVLG